MRVDDHILCTGASYLGLSLRAASLLSVMWPVCALASPPSQAFGMEAPRDVTPPITKLAQVEGDEEVLDVGAPALDEEFYPLDVPVTVNDAVVGDITVEATLSGFARLDPDRLIELLGDRLGPDRLATLQELSGEKILLERLQSSGLVVVYDPSSLTLKITLPLEGVQGVSISQRNLASIDFENVQQPANFSAGVSVIAQPRFVHSSPSERAGWGPFAADMRGFVSVGGFENVALVFEGDFVEGRESEFQRSEITLIKDDFDDAIRYWAGDIRPSITAFQSSVNLLGLGVERNYGTIQPFRNLRPGGRTSFVLDRPARVTFEVNGIVVQTTDLQPGEFDIQDFPLITGSNEVRILVDDEFGLREVGSYSTYVDTSLLGEGLTIFGLNAGVRRENGRDGFGFNYDDDPIAMGFIETGISDNLTLGAQGEVTSDGAYLGGRAVQAIGESVLGFEVGTSGFKNSDPGVAAAATWTFRPADTTFGRWSLQQASVAVEHQTESFQTLGNNFIPRGEITMVAAQASANRGALSASIGSAWVQTAENEITTANASLRFPLDFASASIGYQYRNSRDRNGGDSEDDHRLLLTLSRNFGAAGTVRFRGATNPDFGELEWRRLSSRSVGEWSGRAAYRVGEDFDELGVDASWITPFAEFDLRHTTQAGSGFGAVDTSVSDMRIGVGAGFADGDFAIGRPIGNGFVIASPHESLDGKTVTTAVGVDRVSAKSSAMTLGDDLLIPLLGSYREQAHRIEVEDLPLGYDLGSGEIAVFPSQYSGYKVTIGSEPGIMVIGKFLDAAGEPMSLAAGALVPEGGGEGITFFTNRTGRFVAEKTKPGTYQIILKPDDRVVGTIDVIEGEEGILRVGNITLKENGS